MALTIKETPLCTRGNRIIDNANAGAFSRDQPQRLAAGVDLVSEAEKMSSIEALSPVYLSMPYSDAGLH